MTEVTAWPSVWRCCAFFFISVTFTALLLAHNPFGAEQKKKRKSPLSPSVVFFLSVKNQPTILLQKKHTIYMAETHPPIKKFTRSKNNDMLLLLVSSTANVAQLKQRETSGGFFISISGVQWTIWIKTSSSRSLCVDPSLEGYGLCSSWV